MSTLAQQIAVQNTKRDAERAALLAEAKQKKEEAKAAKKKAALPAEAPAPAPVDDDNVSVVTTTGHISRSQTFGVAVSPARICKVLQKEMYGEHHQMLETLRKDRSAIDKQLFAPKIKTNKDGTPVQWTSPSEDLKKDLMAKKAVLNEQIKKLSTDEFQVSRDVDVLVSTLLDMVLKSLADFTFINTLQAGFKTATLEYTIGEAKPKMGHVPLQKCQYWGILASTRVIKEYDSFTESELMKKRRAENAAEKARKEKLRDELIAQGKDPKKEAAKRTRAPVDPEADPQLKEYMKIICSSLKKTNYKDINTSARLTEQMSEIALDITRSLAKSIRHIINLTKRRTATAAIVETAIMCALENAGVDEATLQTVKEHLSNKVEIHTDQTKSRSIRAKYRLEERFKNLSPEEQQAIIAKKHAEDLAKNEASIESKRRQAETALAKAKELQEKMAQMQLQAQQASIATPEYIAAYNQQQQQLLAQQQMAAQQQQQQMVAQQQQQMAAQQQQMTAQLSQ